MKIAGGTVAMQSQHYAATRTEEKETLHVWVGAQRPDFEGTPSRQAAPLSAATAVQISAAGHAAQATTPLDQTGDGVENDPMLALVKAVVEWITGKPIRVFNPAQLQAPASTPPLQDPRQEPAAATPPAAAAAAAGFGIEYDYHAVREEVEQTSFTAQGSVRTADGQEISFNLELSMSRQYREETNISVRAGDAKRKDPLVINFSGTAAQLANRQFLFDLNSDGSAQNISLLEGGSGFLALDLNHNGSIDNGSELFGPASGSGYSELARHDQDHNGWIDENDPVFKDLRVWTPAADGKGTLATLAERNVGALYLGHSATPFALRGEANRDLGAVAASGLYLTTSGAAGSLQEIDLTI